MPDQRKDAKAQRQRRKLARRIARDLFTTFNKEKIGRLVVERVSGELAGGYCEQAVEDLILKHLCAFAPLRRCVKK